MKFWKLWTNKKILKKNDTDSLMNKGEDIYHSGAFEFLIRGEIELSEGWEEIMTPNSLSATMITKDDWPYFVVGNDEYPFSFEEVGIQMTFNEEIKFEKAKKNC